MSLQLYTLRWVKAKKIENQFIYLEKLGKFEKLSLKKLEKELGGTLAKNATSVTKAAVF